MSDEGNGEKTGRGGNIPPVEHRFKLGNAGGPGRPPGRGLAEILRRIAAEEVGKGRKKQTRAERMLRNFLARAESRSDRAVIEILDRLDGKVPQSHEISGPDGSAIPVNVGDIDNELRSLLAAGSDRLSNLRGKSQGKKATRTEKTSGGAE